MANLPVHHRKRARAACRARWLVSAFALLLSNPGIAADPTIPLPAPARVEVQVDTVHGVAVRDPYRWMEDTDSTEFKAWAAGQARYADALLAQDGAHQPLQDAIAAMLGDAPTLATVVPTAGRVLLTRWLEDGPVLRAVDDGAAAEYDLLTPAMLRAAGRGGRIRAVTPSWDGRFAAITTTGAGDTAPQVSVLDLRSRRLLPDHITDLLTTTSASRYRVAWLPDSSGFAYPRLSATALTGAGGERYARGRQVVHHIGTPVSDDVPVFGHGVDPAVPTDDEDLPAAIVMAPGSRWIVARLSRTTRDTSELWAAPLDAVLTGRHAWKRVSVDGHGAPQLRGDRLYAVTSEAADRRRIVARDLSAGTPADWGTVVPERDGMIRDFRLAGGALYFTELRDARESLYRTGLQGGEATAVALPIAGGLRFAASADARADVWVEAANWIDPGGWFRIRPDGTAVRAAVAPGGSVPDTGDLVVEHLMLPADDGAQIPVSVVRPRGRALDGTLPLLLEAYGSFGKIQVPEFNPYIALWVRQGAAYAYAHVRGGGERGDAWHRAALRETKSRTTMDVLSVAQALVARGYTRPERTALHGMSNGAQPAGMALLARPGQFGAVVYNVGQPDDLRGARIDPTSARNLGELGDTRTRRGVELLLSNSPYYQLPPALALPAVVVKSAPDDYNYGSTATTAKYVARLQAANRGDHPVAWIHQPGGHSWLFDGIPEQDARLMGWLLAQLDPERQTSPHRPD